MASSSSHTNDSDHNDQPPSPPTTFSPTPALSNSYTSRSWRHRLGYNDAPPSMQTPRTSFLRGPLLPSAMQPQAPAAPDTSLRPLPVQPVPTPAYDPADIPPPERALLPVQPRPIMGFPTLPPGRIFIWPTTGNDPWPTDDSSDDDAPWNHPAPAANQLPPPQQFILISSDDKDLDTLEPPHSDPDIPESVSSTTGHLWLLP
ncbi:uncharacterized protein ARMOST_21532 [Armillaria ostoyae]|uniref:Uncharacterized protein n=1 Tax=Armillaria ostoyae TaxID=47428 RepID=A0A284SAD0_ARMOS|nr:uncharacterized protein ARMOST_21532 [Armillaria ostoyae]